MKKNDDLDDLFANAICNSIQENKDEIEQLKKQKERLKNKNKKLQKQLSQSEEKLKKYENQENGIVENRYIKALNEARKYINDEKLVNNLFNGGGSDINRTENYVLQIIDNALGGNNETELDKND